MTLGGVAQRSLGVLSDEIVVRAGGAAVNATPFNLGFAGVTVRSGAELIAPPPDTTSVHFGSSVTIERNDGRRQTWRIVGEDEADPAAGSLSYVSPVAQVLAGRKVGEVVQAGNSEAEIVAIE